MISTQQLVLLNKGTHLRQALEDEMKLNILIIMKVVIKSLQVHFHPIIIQSIKKRMCLGQSAI